MKHSVFYSVLLLAAAFLAACKKDYTIGGSVHDPHVNMTTYDYLKTNPLFDTVLIMIDKMGLKEEVNSAGTFFSITDYDLSNYIKEKQEYLRIKLDDENLVYNFDSLNMQELKDSLRAYLFKDQITRDNTTERGRMFKANNGETRLVQLIPTNDYTDGNVFTQKPKYLYLTKMIPLPGLPVPADSTQLGNLKPEQLLQARCQTSGIITTTGVLHVLNNGHTFTYFGNKFN